MFSSHLSRTSSPTLLYFWATWLLDIIFVSFMFICSSNTSKVFYFSYSLKHFLKRIFKLKRNRRLWERNMLAFYSHASQVSKYSEDQTKISCTTDAVVFPLTNIPADKSIRNITVRHHPSDISLWNEWHKYFFNPWHFSAVRTTKPRHLLFLLYIIPIIFAIEKLGRNNM